MVVVFNFPRVLSVDVDDFHGLGAVSNVLVPYVEVPLKVVVLSDVIASLHRSVRLNPRRARVAVGVHVHVSGVHGPHFACYPSHCEVSL